MYKNNRSETERFSSQNGSGRLNGKVTILQVLNIW